MSLLCYHCGGNLEQLVLPIGRLDQCPSCSRYIHACAMCTHFDLTETSKQCSEDDAEKVQDKMSANFCEYYAVSEHAFKGGGAIAERNAQAELAELFGESANATDMADLDAKPSNKEEAIKNAEALFSKS